MGRLLISLVAAALLVTGHTDPLSNGNFRWRVSPPLVAPVERPDDPCISIKDPTVVRFDGRWHLFCTIRSVKRSHQIEYLNFEKWTDANAADRHILTISDGYFCAPQVFHFTPHKKWYMILQVRDETRKPSLQPAFCTTDDLSKPASWSKPALLYPKAQPASVKSWIDFWVICDDAHAHLFFTSNDGRMWRAQTPLADFPLGWSEPQVVLEADVFEASHTYRLKGRDQYLTVIEAVDPRNGGRYYKAYVADRLDGKWNPLADTIEHPFAGSANTKPAGERWTDSISHGELLRTGFDEGLEVDPADLRMLFQGVLDRDRMPKPYGEIPWRLGLLEPGAQPASDSVIRNADSPTGGCMDFLPPRVRIGVGVFLLVLFSGVPAARALIQVSVGNDPVPADAGWPAGSVDVANLESRLGFWVGPPFGGGEHHFEYRGDTAAFQRALDLLAKVDAPQRIVVIHEGPAESTFLNEKKDEKAKARYDWAFVVWNKSSYDRLYNDKGTFMADDPSGNFRRPVPAPRIDVYVGGTPAGEGVDWSRIAVPDNVKVTDERASSNGYAADAGSVLRGRVVDLADGKPVAGAKILVTKHTGKQGEFEDVTSGAADADGRFEVTRVPPGSYRLHAEADGRAPRLIGYATFGKDTLKDYPDVRLAPAVALAGTITDNDGKPIADVAVHASDFLSADGFSYPPPSTPSAKTDANGRFTLSTLPAGTCRLIAFAKGYSRVEPMKRHTIPDANLELRMLATGNVHGKVTVGGGAPDAPFIAEITPEGGNKVGSWGGSSTVKADGTFDFENVPPGKYVVTAKPNPGKVIKGKDPNEKLIEVKAGVTLDVEIAVK